MPLLLAAAVPVLAWDHHVHDSLGKSNRVDKESGQPSRLLWDGSKKSQVAEELQKKPSGKEACQPLIHCTPHPSRLPLLLCPYFTNLI